MFNHHILMLLSTQLGQVQSTSWSGASSHFPDDNTALCQPSVLSGTGRRVIKNGPLWWVKSLNKLHRTFPSWPAVSREVWEGLTLPTCASQNALKEA